MGRLASISNWRILQLPEIFFAAGSTEDLALFLPGGGLMAVIIVAVVAARPDRPARQIFGPVACGLLAASSFLAAGAARGEVTTVEWAPGRPPQWTEKTIASPHRVVIEIPPPPPGHECLTVVIETPDGKRVRNLLGQAPRTDILKRQHPSVFTYRKSL